jgi:hypothetical protein
MTRQTPFFMLLFVLVFFGIGGLFRFSHNVRSVDALALFASGVACGAALAGLIAGLRTRVQ